jgi:hypothetical protein
MIGLPSPATNWIQTCKAIIRTYTEIGPSRHLCSLKTLLLVGNRLNGKNSTKIIDQWYLNLTKEENA